MTFAEDASRIRTGSTPRVMVSLSNLAVGPARLAGWTNIDQVDDHHRNDPDRALPELDLAT
ncbi:hypothetical protein ACFVYE_04670 [Streptomyces sp. NPDC058239]|uniref:hypothetical protein n=1 Tax=unclassified Streptomyces TaxID=2593676 RepID=UPI00365AC9FB